MKYIYLDNASTTPTDQEVLEAMQPYFSKEYGNVSSMHQMGQKPLEAVEESRMSIAKFFGCNQKEIIFTSGASESNNMAIKGVAEALRGQGKHLLINPIDHSSVVHTAQHLANSGFKVTWLKTDKYGIIDEKFLVDSIGEDTTLVSIGHSNNEIGTLQPVADLVKLVKKENPKILFHTDATQSVQYFDLNVDKLGVDLLSLTGHKFYAPKGIGALYSRQGVHLEKIIDGGQQEFGKRSGTENVPYIIGMAKAIELVTKNRQVIFEQVSQLSNKLIKKIPDLIPDTELTGHPIARLPHVVNYIFKKIEGESIMLLLDKKGIAVSTGSACASHSLTPSHVLTGIGYPADEAHGSIRFSLGKHNKETEIDYLLEVLPPIIQQLRKISPLK
ncbi:MAG: cysteine desulfurase family protein [Patescibacteria group bacterium]